MSDDADLLGELEDLDEQPGFNWSRLDPTQLGHPVVLRRFGAIAVALVILFLPGRGTVALGRLVGIGLVVYALAALWVVLRERPVPWLSTVAATAMLTLGGLLVAAPLRTEAALGRTLGLALAAKGLWDLIRAWRGDRVDLGWRTTSSLATVAVGGFVATFPTQLLSALAFSLAILWIVTEMISIAALLDPRRDVDVEHASTAVLIAEWFRARPKTVQDRQRLYHELLFEGEATQARIVRFGMLMVFASVIASMGVVSDSTAVVVGAMLIAPLMTPLMAMALSLVMGWPNRLARSSLIALGGILLAIGIGLVVGLADFTIVDTITNSQITSRSNPTPVDLVTAVAAGAAGAYGLSRPDVSNSLPGVAIAIALVPPLTVVGISYSQRDWESGSGALLLFLTNAVAILVVGGLMFLALGVAPLSQVAENQHRVRTSLAAIVGASALIVGALVLNGNTLASNVFEQRIVQSTVNDWIEAFPEHTTISVSVAGDTVSVVLAGPVTFDAPSAELLAESLSDELEREISVDLRIRLEQRELSG